MKTVKMKTNVTTLNDGNKMPLVGLGTWKLSGKECEEAVLAALKAGYRHIDTATYYKNEESIGKAIKKSGIPRKDIFITTKLWETDHGDPEAALDASLAKLGLDYVDLYLIHSPSPERLETWKTFEKLQKKGKCKSIGVSNFTIKHLQQLLKSAKVVPAVNQVEFNPFLYQKDLLDFCRKNNIVLEAYCPIARGSKFSNKIIDELTKIYGKTQAQIMLRWAVQKQIVVIPKSSDSKRQKENIDIFNFEIRSNDVKKLDNLNENFRLCWDPTDVQ
jgi:diketogulonate reductase-like aldo/keto reductase